MEGLLCWANLCYYAAMARYEKVVTKRFYPEHGFGNKSHIEGEFRNRRFARQKAAQANEILKRPNTKVPNSLPDNAHDLALLQKSWARIDIRNSSKDIQQALRMNKGRAELMVLKENPEWLIGG